MKRQLLLPILFAQISTLAGSAAALAEATPFAAEAVISTAADNVWSVTTGDVDGDGDMDVLSASELDDKIAWYEHSGAFWLAHAISTAAAGATSVFAGDVDGDGDLDALSASINDDEITWHENTLGDGSAWTPHPIALDDGAFRVWADDVDGDGDLDALSASYYFGNTLAWHRNNFGDGSNWTTIPIANPNGPRAIFTGDMDRDGDLDVLSASEANDTVAWYENTAGDGLMWSAPITITATADGARSVFAADLDRDGDPDVLSASFHDDKIAWYENIAGDGLTWSTPITITTAALMAEAVFAGDLDGDGDLDALSASISDDKIAWYENTAGDGSAWFARTLSTTADYAQSVVAADVDRDGDLDALSASAHDNKIAWYENTLGDGSAWFARTISSAAATPGLIYAASVFAGDVDGDGDPDALSASLTDDQIAWHENTLGDGTAWTLHLIPNTANGPRSVFAADVDRDGDLDALSASVNDDKIAWYENTAGDGSAWFARTISTAANFARSVYAADVDRDGDPDVLSASESDDEIAWYENTLGNGTAWKRTIISTAANGAFSVFAGDVDGDGDLDVLSASVDDDKIAWYKNNAVYRDFLPLVFK